MKNTKIGYKDIFCNKEYMKTVIAAAINRFGDSIDSIAVTWLVYQLTQSAAWSAIIFGVNRIPTIFLQPFAGAAIEGKNKKYVMIFTDIIRGLCVGFIATAFLMGFLNKWMLLICTIIISSAEAFRGPASNALIPKLLTKEQYDFGLSLNSSARSASELIGYGAAGAIIASFSISTAIYIDMATFFISALIIFTLTVKEENMAKGRIKVKEYVENLKEGYTYLKDKKVLSYFLVLAIFINGILVPFNSLQAPLVSEVLNTSEIMLSVISISLTVGMILGAAIYPIARRKISNRTIACLGYYSLGMYYFTFVIVGKYIESPVLMFIIISIVSFEVGIVISFLNSFINVEFIKNIKENFVARVSAIMGSTCVLAIPLVSFIVSTLAGWVPTEVIFIIAGTLDIIICTCLCSKKRFMAMEKYETGEVINEQVGGDMQSC